LWQSMKLGTAGGHRYRLRLTPSDERPKSGDVSGPQIRYSVRRGAHVSMV
jgi:hypothetical protein